MNLDIEPKKPMDAVVWLAPELFGIYFKLY